MSTSSLRTSVHPDGQFLVGIHRPSYHVMNLRDSTPSSAVLGSDEHGVQKTNAVNFPHGTVDVRQAAPVVEIPNPFPFWGTTYILEAPAGRCAENPFIFTFNALSTEERSEDRNGFLQALVQGEISGPDGKPVTLSHLPSSMLLALAQNSRDPDILAGLARLSCEFEYGPDGQPCGIRYRRCSKGDTVKVIHNYPLFKTVSNNPALPDSYKLAMVLKPGIQGTSPVVGEFGAPGEQTHIWEYLRANSYIPYGHFAANMAQDAVRYSVSALDMNDMRGLRSLYYQRVYVTMAMALGLVHEGEEKPGSMCREPERLEELRLRCLDAIRLHVAQGRELPFSATLWGWNYGYDFSPSGYRLHASHQMVHQQFALIPPSVPYIHACKKIAHSPLPSYAVGDQVEYFISRYQRTHGIMFFSSYLKAISNNCRMDGRSDLPSELVVWEDENVMLHVPKAQRSQGEVQIMAKTETGNIIESDTGMRLSLDNAVLRAVKTLAEMGAEMITCYEVSKRFDSPCRDQRLFYCFLPRHSRSPGAFSERQGRWITGHYPEDFARAFRQAMERNFT